MCLCGTCQTRRRRNVADTIHNSPEKMELQKTESNYSSFDGGKVQNLRRLEALTSNTGQSCPVTSSVTHLSSSFQLYRQKDYYVDACF